MILLTFVSAPPGDSTISEPEATGLGLVLSYSWATPSPDLPEAPDFREFA